VNIKGKRQDTEAERANGLRRGSPGWRGVLGALAALPFVLHGTGSATPTLAVAGARPGRVLLAAGDLVRGAERR
jgi:hypothetical protein